MRLLQAQKVLSAVSDLEERFGAGYLIDFLRGKGASKIQEGHRALKTFGIGADTSKEEWSAIIRELLGRNYVAKTGDIYPVLTLTEKSADVLNGTAIVQLARIKGQKTQTSEATKTDYEVALYNQLKDLRRELATEENVPAYIILSDATLVELSTYLPHTMDELSGISGFGYVKLERYGKKFQTMIANIARNNS